MSPNMTDSKSQQDSNKKRNYIKSQIKSENLLSTDAYSACSKDAPVYPCNRSTLKSA